MFDHYFSHLWAPYPLLYYALNMQGKIIKRLAKAPFLLKVLANNIPHHSLSLYEKSSIKVATEQPRVEAIHKMD
jgi:hypothetical protein